MYSVQLHADFYRVAHLLYRSPDCFLMRLTRLLISRRLVLDMIGELFCDAIPHLGAPDLLCDILYK